MMIHYPRDAVSDFLSLCRRSQEIGWKQACAEVLQPDAPGTWQLSKYLMIGAASVIVFYAAYGMFRVTVEHGLGLHFDKARVLWNWSAIAFAFVPTNWFTYTTNRRWVFVPGRHDAGKEFVLFTMAAAASFLASQGLVWVLIRHTGLGDLWVTSSVIVMSTLTNFLIRKFFVFSR